ncbi:MAG: hypothetical protein WB789_04905 [Thermoplasmata archaeon]
MRAVVEVFASHVCADHGLLAEIGDRLRLAEHRGAFPRIELVFGCPDLSGSPPGSSVATAWKSGIDHSGGVLFLWTKDALYSEGTAKEWKYVKEAKRPYCMAVEEGAELPQDESRDPKRIKLPCYVDASGGILTVRTKRPAVRRFTPYGPDPVKFDSEVRAFAKSILKPLV